MDWIVENNVLVKEFTLTTFSEALTFMNTILPLAEELNHHPDMLLHSYNKVKIMLVTHDEQKVTEKDYALAKKIDAM